MHGTFSVKIENIAYNVDFDLFTEYPSISIKVIVQPKMSLNNTKISFLERKWGEMGGRVCRQAYFRLGKVWER
jgi:hypothetical protein